MNRELIYHRVPVISESFLWKDHARVQPQEVKKSCSIACSQQAISISQDRVLGII